MKTEISNFFLNLRILLLQGFVLVFSHALEGQITGKITDSKGNPLSYASVYQENTSRGTVCNDDGVYEFTPEGQGTIQLQFHYVGYKKKTVSVSYKGTVMELNMVLEEDEALVDEIVITANREDPAYPIIRKAIERRSFHKKWIPSFEADLYVKGLIKILDAPEIFMGNKVQDLGGILDSFRQGIIYLSESQSKYYFMLPDKTKEIMVSTKKSGSNSLFTANQFSFANVNLYDNYTDMGRSVMSPIADLALSAYSYRLVQVQIDDKARTIYKIQVTPKSNVSPLMNGLLYIVGDTYNIHSADFALSGASLKIPLIDTLRFRQVYVPLSTGEWPLFSQTMFFKGGFFGFGIGGNFTYIFSNYNTTKDIGEVFKNKEVFKVNKDALNQDSLYWAANRPVPLTTEENLDYKKKDSLQIIWSSKAYLDSVDRKGNKLNFSDILLGYSYSNRYKNYSLNYPDPLSLVRFNVVEGWNMYINPNYTYTDSAFRNWVINPLVVYGFSDKTWKPSLKISRNYDPEMMGKISLEFGKKYEQYDENDPILLRSNTWASLFYKLNYIRLFGKNFLKFTFEKELVNSLHLTTYAEWARRWPLDKLSDFSFFHKNRIFENNIPNNNIDPEVFKEHETGNLYFRFTWSPGQTYSSYPNFRSRNPGKWPVVTLENQVGVPLSPGKKVFYKARLQIADPSVSLNRFGYFAYHMEWAGSVINQPVFFQDFNHPLGNEWIIPDGNRQNMYNLLPFYTYSTAKYYTGFHWKHHFNGYIMDKLPLLKKTSLKTIMTVNYLWNPEQKNYLEAGIGIENIILGQIPVGSIEYFWSWSTYFPRDRGFILKMTQMITN